MLSFVYLIIEILPFKAWGGSFRVSVEHYEFSHNLIDLKAPVFAILVVLEVQCLDFLW